MDNDTLNLTEGLYMAIDINNIIEAVKEARESGKKRNFLQSFDLIINLKDLDLKQPRNRISGTITLPHKFSKPRKILVFGEGDLAVRAKKLGLPVLGKKDIEILGGDKKRIKKLAEEYDIILASTDLMPHIGRYLGQVLGPRDKMPIPIPPTIKLEDVIENYQKMVKYRVKNTPVLQVKVGDENMDDQQIAENIRAVIDNLLHKLERGLANIGSIYVKKTMGPAVQIKI